MHRFRRLQVINSAANEIKCEAEFRCFACLKMANKNKSKTDKKEHLVHELGRSVRDGAAAEGVDAGLRVQLPRHAKVRHLWAGVCRVH